MVNFGEWIRFTRTQKGLSEEECQSRSGMTQPNWSRLINNPPAQPRKSTMEAVARALDVPITEVFAAAGYEDVTPIDVRLARQIEPYLMRLRPDQRPRAERMLVNQAKEISELLAV